MLPYEGLVATYRTGLRACAAAAPNWTTWMRCSPGSSRQARWSRSFSGSTPCTAWRSVGSGVNSPRAIERTVDKFWTSALLEQCGIPTPETIVCDNAEEAFAAFRALGDVIVKPLFGSMGLGMVRVSDEEMAFRVFRTIEQIRGVYYLQRD